MGFSVYEIAIFTSSQPVMKNIFLLLSLLACLLISCQKTSNQELMVLEGYLFDDTCFYEKQGDKCLGREGTEYTDKIKNKDFCLRKFSKISSRETYFFLKPFRTYRIRKALTASPS